MNRLITFLLIQLLCFSQIHAQEPLDTLLADMEIEVISQNQFEQFKAGANGNTRIDTSGYIEFLDLWLVNDCFEICETYLQNSDSTERVFLPSHFDQGIIDLLFSPSGKKFIIYSSYDGPDYTNYCSYRAEILVYNIEAKNGLKGIKPTVKFITNEWSIDDLVWVSESVIALKTYKGIKSIAGVDSGYEYIQANIANDK